VNAVVIAVGSELLFPGRRDTNAEWLIERLLSLGTTTSWRAAVEDDVDRIAALVRQASESAPLVVVTGGLGPTEDDRTREGLAQALGVALERDPAMVARIERLFASRGRPASRSQARQADRPAGATWIENPLGSAPGLVHEKGGRIVAALPGVPAEMKAMFDGEIAPRLAGESVGLVSRTLRVAGRPESWVDERLRDLYGTPGTQSTILASSGTIELVLTARGRDRGAAAERLAGLEAEIRSRLGRDLFGADGDTLASVVGDLLVRSGRTIAVAESCTGGLLGGALTEVPGSSRWFRGGLVCYANDLKTRLAGVDEAVLRVHGAVSETVARALAAGARRACGADYGVAVTGVAGPDGGSAEKPVGTVHIALDDGAEGRAMRLDWPGDRSLIRRRAVAVALDLVRRRLLDG
jgi:competence/damage-inducible protein CinA-like protein